MLMLMIPAVQFLLKPARVTLSSILLLVCLAYATLSFLWAPFHYEFLYGYSHLLLLAGAFLVGASIQSLRPVLIGSAVGLGINSLFVCIQLYGWSIVPQVASPAGLFMNKNLLAEFSVLILLGLFYERLWLWIIPVLPCVILTSGRGALVALVAGLLLALPLWLGWMIAIVGVGAGISYSFFATDPSMLQRFDIWMDTLQSLTWFGHGWGQFYITFPQFATHMDTLLQRPEHAHSDILELIYEIGLGIILIVAFVASLWRNKLIPEQAILLGFLVEGLFGFPLYIPTTAVVFAIVAGRLSTAGPSLCADFNAGRDSLRIRMAALTGLPYSQSGTRDGE
jgi:hypothetical protein